MQVAAFLAARPDFERVPIVAAEIGAEPEWITAQGELQDAAVSRAAGPARPFGHRRLLRGAAAADVLNAHLSTNHAQALSRRGLARVRGQAKRAAWPT